MNIDNYMAIKTSTAPVHPEPEEPVTPPVEEPPKKKKVFIVCGQMPAYKLNEICRLIRAVGWVPMETMKPLEYNEEITGDIVKDRMIQLIASDIVLIDDGDIGRKYVRLFEMESNAAAVMEKCSVQLQELCRKIIDNIAKDTSKPGLKEDVDHWVEIEDPDAEPGEGGDGDVDHEVDIELPEED